MDILIQCVLHYPFLLHFGQDLGPVYLVDHIGFLGHTVRFSIASNASGTYLNIPINIKVNTLITTPLYQDSDVLRALSVMVFIFF